MLNRIHRARARTLIAFVSLCLAWLMLVPANLAWADLPPGEAAWVCVTVHSLIDPFEELADHRRGQGLSARVVSLTDLSVWDDAVFPDQESQIRWFVTRAAEVWGTRYVLLGGDYDQVPAPITRRETTVGVETAPVDLYYACLDGTWDGDGDGWVAEPDEEYDAYPEVAVGRLPADDIWQATAMVAKTLAFEGRSASRRGHALLAASELPGPAQEIGARRVADLVAGFEAAADGPTPTPMLQAWESVPGAEPLSPGAFVTRLADADFDHVYFFGSADAEHWDCGGQIYLEPTLLDVLEGSGRTFVLDANTCDGLDIMAEGIAERMMAVPGGGAVAARGYASLPYVVPMFHFDDVWWEFVAAGGQARLGDLHNAALVAAWTSTTSDFVRDHLPMQMLFGDPALALQPAVTVTVDPDRRHVVRDLDAMPNPFNPSTIVAFTVDGPGEGVVRVHVEIFDLRGRHVATLMDEDLPPGEHSAVWRTGTSEVGAGVYFARVSAGGSADAVKLVRVD